MILIIVIRAVLLVSGGPRDGAKNPTMFSIVPTTKNYPVQNVRITKDGKPFFRVALPLIFAGSRTSMQTQVLGLCLPQPSPLPQLLPALGEAWHTLMQTTLSAHGTLSTPPQT